MEKLTQEQAYAAMFLFLAQYYERTQSDDVGGLLSDLQIMPDGRSADPAVMVDWYSCLEKAQYHDHYPEIIYFRLIKPE